MVGVTKRADAVPGACGACDREALCYGDGSATVYYATCHASWSWADYQDAMHYVPEVAE